MHQHIILKIFKTELLIKQKLALFNIFSSSKCILALWSKTMWALSLITALSSTTHMRHQVF